MIKKMISVFTAMIAALLVVGVAWAGSDDSAASKSLDDSSTTRVTIDESTLGTTGAGSVTSTSLDDTTSTTTDDHGNDDNNTTSTTIDDHANDDNNTTSTTIDDHGNDDNNTTSTTIDDHGNDERLPEDGVSTYSIPPVGAVTMEVRSGHLLLVDFSAPGWDATVIEARSDRVRIDFRSGVMEAEFEAEIRHGAVEIAFKVDSD